MDKPTNSAVNIGTGIVTSVAELLQVFNEKFPGFSSAPNPNTVVEVKDSRLLAREAGFQLGWYTKTSLKDGITKMVEKDRKVGE